MRAVVFQHEAHEGPGLLGPALEAEGFRCSPRFREVHPGDGDAELVVVLGGPMGVYQAAEHPFLQAELDVLRRRLRQDLPCIGICLGAQLMAHAAGARVFPGANGFELGVSPVTWIADGAADEVQRGLPERWPVAHWHQDTFDPVPGAVLLASTPQYRQQAFRIGRSYGFQFHPELDAPTFARWVTEAAGDVARAGVDPSALLAAHVPVLERAHPLLQRFQQNLARAMRAMRPDP